MPSQSFRLNDFSAGWTPSDDIINGRKNGFPVFDNLEIDRNGAIALTGGSKVLYSSYGAPAHDLYSRYLGSTRYDYAALADGSVWRNNSQIITGGDPYNTAFGTAYNFALIASGTQRFKDNGSTLTNLGVTPPSVPPVYLNTIYQSTPSISALANLVAVDGTTATDGNYLKINYDTTGVAPASPNNAIVQTYNVAGTPFDWTTFSDGSVATENDYILLDVKSLGTVQFELSSFTIDFLCVAGDAAGDRVSDYYSYTLDTSSVDVNNTGADSWNLKIRRSAFTRVGSGVGGWNSIYGWRITANCTDSTRTFIEFYPHGDATNPSGFCFYGGDASQDDGWWEFAQMNVNDTGSYLATSALGPNTGFIHLAFGQAVLQLQAPTDPQVNQVWVFARSQPAIDGASALEQWMCVGQITNFSTLSSYTVQFSVEDAVNLGIQANINLLGIDSAEISDSIVSILGPINGRWYYLTTEFLYPSDVNNPDAVDTSLGIRVSGSTSERVQWAVQVAESTVLIGTSVDIYILTGTFATLPDQTIDIYFRALGCKFPAFTRDVTAYGGVAYYYSSDGWRSINGSTGENIQITAPNIDRLFRNEQQANIYNYFPANVNFPPASLRSPITTAYGKLWGASVQTNRIEIYDFVRQYWRNYGLYNWASTYALTATQDGHILMFTADLKLHDICLYNNKQIAGSNSYFQLLSSTFDGGDPNVRKEFYTIRLRCYTGTSGTVNLYINFDDGTQLTVSSNISSSVSGSGLRGPIPQDIYFDLEQFLNPSGTNPTLHKTWQYQILGRTNDFILEDITIFYDNRPQQLTSYHSLPDNSGVASLKRLRDWPMVIDTLGNTIKMTIIADGTPLSPTLNINTSNKQTVHNFVDTDAFATDYEFTLTGGIFELYGVMQPNFVQVLPPPLQFDQVGPEELFKYGRLKQIGIRVYPNGGTRIPYTIYFNDNSTSTGVFTVANQQEATYFVGIPKGNGGEVVRITFGPTAFNFHRYYLYLQTMKSGRDTELQWVILPEGANNMYPYKQTP